MNRTAEQPTGHGAQVEAAQLGQDGILPVTGHHTGPDVGQFPGAAITSYERAYVIAAEQVPSPLTLLDGQEGDNVLDLLPPARGQKNELPRGPQVVAELSNRHS